MGDSPCIIWSGALMANGYGTATVNGRTLIAHRVAYEEANGPIPEGLHIDHLCRVRACVNPDHLEAVTQAENNRRIFALQCRNGHARTPENTRIEGGKSKRCLDCRKESKEEDLAMRRKWSKENREKRNEIQRAYRARKKAER